MPTLELEDVTLHYEDRGRGPALVFIHGLGSSGLDWSHQIEHFCRDFRVIAPDLRGYGRSTRTAADYTIGAFSGTSPPWSSAPVAVPPTSSVFPSAARWDSSWRWTGRTWCAAWPSSTAPRT